MKFEILGEIEAVETIASGRGVDVRARLRKVYGKADFNIKAYLDEQ